mgnify:CR=1 FL=1
MITDNMRKENEIIVEALTKMRQGAQRRVEDGSFNTAVNNSELSYRVELVRQFDALISQHTPKQPTKNEAVVDKIQELFSKRHGRNWRFTDAGRSEIIQVLNEEYPE